MVAPITTAAALADHALLGGGRAVAASSTGTRTAEVSAGHLPLVPFDISHHAPLVRMPSSRVAISDVPILCSRCSFVAVLRVLTSLSATPNKVFIRTDPELKGR